MQPPRRPDRRWPPSPRMRAYALRCIDAGEPARAVARRLRLAPGTIASWCHRRELRAERERERARSRAALVDVLARLASVLPEHAPLVTRARCLTLTRSAGKARAAAAALAVDVEALAASVDRRAVIASTGDGRVWAHVARLVREALAETYRTGLLPASVDRFDGGAASARAA